MGSTKKIYEHEVKARDAGSKTKAEAEKGLPDLKSQIQLFGISFSQQGEREKKLSSTLSFTDLL